MGRALLLVCLVASPAFAQVNSRFGPYSTASPSSLTYFRSYTSVDRLNLQKQNRTMSYGQLVNNPWSRAIPGPRTRAAGFRFYPNYPSLNAKLGSSNTTLRGAGATSTSAA